MLEAITDIDLSILHALRASIATPTLDAVMPFVTSLGNAAFVWLVLAVALMCTKKYRPYGIAVIIAVSITALIGEIGIKNLVERPRPFLADPSLAIGLIPPPESFSFPSGHTGSSFAAATALAFIPFKNAWIKLIPFLGAATVAFSRLYLCVHFPSDICGGITLGVCCGVAASLLVKKTIEKRSFEKHTNGTEETAV